MQIPSLYESLRYCQPSQAFLSETALGRAKFVAKTANLAGHSLTSSSPEAGFGRLSKPHIF